MLLLLWILSFPVWAEESHEPFSRRELGSGEATPYLQSVFGKICGRKWTDPTRRLQVRLDLPPLYEMNDSAERDLVVTYLEEVSMKIGKRRYSENSEPNDFVRMVRRMDRMPIAFEPKPVTPAIRLLFGKNGGIDPPTLVLSPTFSEQYDENPAAVEEDMRRAFELKLALSERKNYSPQNVVEQSAVKTYAPAGERKASDAVGFFSWLNGPGGHSEKLELEKACKTKSGKDKIYYMPYNEPLWKLGRKLEEQGFQKFLEKKTDPSTLNGIRRDYWKAFEESFPEDQEEIRELKEKWEKAQANGQVDWAAAVRLRELLGYYRFDHLLKLNRPLSAASACLLDSFGTFGEMRKLEGDVDCLRKARKVARSFPPEHRAGEVWKEHFRDLSNAVLEMSSKQRPIFSKENVDSFLDALDAVDAHPGVPSKWAQKFTDTLGYLGIARLGREIKADPRKFESLTRYQSSFRDAVDTASAKVSSDALRKMELPDDLNSLPSELRPLYYQLNARQAEARLADPMTRALMENFRLSPLQATQVREQLGSAKTYDADRAMAKVLEPRLRTIQDTWKLHKEMERLRFAENQKASPNAELLSLYDRMGEWAYDHESYLQKLEPSLNKHYSTPGQREAFEGSIDSTRENRERLRKNLAAIFPGPKDLDRRAKRLSPQVLEETREAFQSHFPSPETMRSEWLPEVARLWETGQKETAVRAAAWAAVANPPPIRAAKGLWLPLVPKYSGEASASNIVVRLGETEKDVETALEAIQQLQNGKFKGSPLGNGLRRFDLPSGNGADVPWIYVAPVRGPKGLELRRVKPSEVVSE